MSEIQLSPEVSSVVVVGAGHGGGSAVFLLRQRGFRGPVVLIGAEPDAPYHRPPLSKSLCTGVLEQPLQPVAYYAEHDIELRTGTTVQAIDVQARTVILDSGELVPYHALILATGSCVRRLDTIDVTLPGVHELRTINDAKALQDQMLLGRRLVIVGGGWIGLEVAASARAGGVEVTIIEREARPLARVSSRELSDHLVQHHRARGTEILVSANVAQIRSAGSGLVVELTDGHAIEADFVLVGVGAAAHQGLAEAAGVLCDGGVVVDGSARTSVPGIYAIGDMTRRPVPLHDGGFRLESIPSAMEQARQAIADILDQPAPPLEVPWFWSDQFDLKIQIAGLYRDTDAVTVRADPAAGRFAAFHTRNGRLVAVETVNAGAEFMAGKHLIKNQVGLDLARLADITIRLDEVGVTTGTINPISTGPIADPSVRQTPVDLPGPVGEPGNPRVTFIQSDGQVNTVAVSAGSTVMEGSVRNGLKGIIGECGGMASCGTCHIYIGKPWGDMLAEAELEEADLLEFIADKQPDSRLACQITLTDELDGVVIRVAAFDG